MKAIKLTAHLSNGFVSSDPWSPSIDNILSYWHMFKKLSPEQFAVSCNDVDQLNTVNDLPISHENFGEDWWYQCSSPIVEDKVAEWITHFNRRFDIQHAEENLWQKNNNKILRLQTGNLKNKRTRLVKNLCKSICWHVVGDPEQIMFLLSDCTHIGAQTSRGFGEVMKWSFSDGDENLARFHRPLPIQFANKNGICGAEIEWGYRPASRKKENQALCILPI